MQRHNPLQILGQMSAPGGLALGERHVGDGVGVGDVVHVGKHVAGEGLAVEAQASHTDTTKADTVVGTFSADEPHLVALAANAVVLQSHLQRGVHGRGAAHGEEDVGKVLARQELEDLLGELVGQPVGGAEARGEVQLGRLVLDRLDDLGLTMTCVDTPQARHAV
jgi:hypothetical protein